LPRGEVDIEGEEEADVGRGRREGEDEERD